MTDSVPIASTRLLRGSDQPLYQRLRALLRERDVDPKTAILADFFPDDVDQEFGLVVTQDRRVIQFVVRYGRFGDLERQAADAVISEWKDITSWWDATAHARDIRVAPRPRAGDVAANGQTARSCRVVVRPRPTK